jgi:hypothetical protein
MRAAWWFLTGLWLVGFSGSTEVANAEEPPAETKTAPGPGWGGPRPPPRDTELAPLPAAPAGTKRAPQDYYGREEVTSAGEDALWVPRILLFPFFVVSEYLIRAPLGAVIKSAESEGAADLPSKIGVAPSLFYEVGFRPHAGVTFFWNDFIATGNDLRAKLTFGGVHFWHAFVRDRIPLSPVLGDDRPRSYLQLDSDFVLRDDLLYWGIGPRTSADDAGTYGLLAAGGGGRLHVEPMFGFVLETWLTGRYAETENGGCRSGQSIVTEDLIARTCDPDPIRQRLALGSYPIPPGFARPYVTMRTGAKLSVDTRDPRPMVGSGVALDVSVEHVSALAEPDSGGWLNYGAVVSGFVDVTGTQRVLGVVLEARFQDTVADETRVPFTELVGASSVEDDLDLGLMRGFKPNRLLGSSAIAATLEYRWPIWAFIDGTLQAAVGNAFAGSHLDDFDPELLRFSFVGGISSPERRNRVLNLLVGFGTDTFTEGGKPSSFRFGFGGTTDF